MSTTALTAAPAPRPRVPAVVGNFTRYMALGLVDAFAIWLITRLAGDGIWELVIALALVTLYVNVVNLRAEPKALRWISPSLALLALAVIYPIVYTVYVAFTNFGDSHLLTKVQATRLLESERYVPDDGIKYQWTGFINSNGEYALWLTDPVTSKEYFALVGQPLREVQRVNGEIPSEFEGFTQFTRAQRVRELTALTQQQFGPPDNPLGVTREFATNFKQRYAYDAAANAIIDNQTGKVWPSNESVGFFMDTDAYNAARAAATDPETVRIEDFVLKTNNFPAGVGFRVTIGFANFARFFNSPALRGPLLTILLWTVTFAFSSVVSTFALGLAVAMLIQGNFRYKRVFKTLLLVPYALPGLIAVVIWKGMFNPQFGVIKNIFGDVPPVFDDPTWARLAILLINLWLGYPYFMLICSGALAAIPSDLYEAAQVDGASQFQAFRHITFPLLLVSVGPLLIASFTFNFNNYTIIEAFNKRRPILLPCTDSRGAYGYLNQLYLSAGLWQRAWGRFRFCLSDFNCHLHHRWDSHSDAESIHEAMGGGFAQCLTYLHQ